jgi:quercetin dioxygenase-like cupin family protein
MDPTRVRDTTTITEGRADKLAKVNLFQTARFFADVWVLRPGQEQAAHRHEREDKLLHVLSGHGRATTGLATHEIGPGQVVFCPAGEEHGVRATGPDDLRLLVLMTPHPKPPASSVQ